MYKLASEFIQESGIWSAGWGWRKEPAAVISFQVRKDNQGRERVFRCVKKFTRRVPAKIFFDRSRTPCKILMYRNTVLEVIGDENLLQLWIETQEGINKNDDPFLGVDYGAEEVRKQTR